MKSSTKESSTATKEPGFGNDPLRELFNFFPLTAMENYKFSDDFRGIEVN